MTQNSNFILIACFFFSGMVWYLIFPSCLEPLQNLRNYRILLTIVLSFIILESQIFIVSVNTLSWPWTLLMSKAQMFCFFLFWSSKSTAEVVAPHKQFVRLDTGLPFSIATHCLAKYTFKKIAFSRKSGMSWSFITSSVIKGVFLPL